MRNISYKHIKPVYRLNTLEKSSGTFDDRMRFESNKLNSVPINDFGNSFTKQGLSPNFNQIYSNEIHVPNQNHLPHIGSLNGRYTHNSGGYFILDHFPELRYNTGYWKQEQSLTYNIDINPLSTQLDFKHNFSDSLKFSFGGQLSTFHLLQSLLNIESEFKNAQFRDLNIELEIRKKQLGRFIFYAVTGQSSDTHTPLNDSLLWENDRDKQHFQLNSSTSVIGFKHFYYSEKTKNPYLNPAPIRTNIALSKWKVNQRTNLLEQGTQSLLHYDSLTNYNVAINTQYENGFYTFGLNTTYHNYMVNNHDRMLNYYSQGVLNSWSIQPTIKRQYQIREKDRHYSNTIADIYIQLKGNYFSYTNDILVEPKILFIRHLDHIKSKETCYNCRIFLDYSLKGTQQRPEIYLSQDARGNYLNNQLDFTKSHNFQTGINMKYHGLRFYYSYFYDVPVSNDSTSNFSLFNDINYMVTESLINAGRGQIYGIELFTFNTKIKNYRFDGNMTFYQSKYKTLENTWRNSRFNGNYNIKLTIDREWELAYLHKKHAYDDLIGIRAFGMIAGGFRTTPINLEQSRLEHQTIFDETNTFSETLGYYSRVDFRIFFKRIKKDRAEIIRSIHILTLDFRNILNRQNPAFQYFDTVQNQVITEYQLGFVPFLAWKIKF